MFTHLLLLLVMFLFPTNQVDKPVFKGGDKELKSFLEQQMVYPHFAKSNCLEATVFISFKLNEKGEVYAEKVERGTGIDLDAEALRLVKLTNGKWILPQDLNVTLTIPFNFSLKDFGCENKSEADKQRAFAYYAIREGLENTVFNYYKNKAIGKANLQDEARIEQLKIELGFDEEFITENYNEALKLIRNGNPAGACNLLKLIRNLGSNKADDLIAKYCN